MTDHSQKAKSSIKQSKESPGKAQDLLYSQPREAITGFVFDESVVSVFQDMIGRSVPGYSTLLSMFPVIAREFVKPETHCYDLGCSLGASTLAMQQGIDKQGVTILSVDNSRAMVEKCKALVKPYSDKVAINVQEADVCEVRVNNASMVVMNFTLQFIDAARRSALIENIFKGMNKGGVFILSEKIQFDTEMLQHRMTDLHHAFKKANGYSDLEISQKRSALENVLVPESIDAHIERLRSVGFSEAFVWFQCFNFVSLMAIK